ncbi:acyl carrier protein [Leptolyngbya sp. 7M]|uniref:acyl carrier protein n=1 Tax=Leptolyngbya sp. 7M TaxID=2812896 RepID=UPI001B8AFEAE|nr:acyl carrier protein [Leptolyngbya sp. 7M]QYO64388.1 acyl carrier protein [Leptolyngbya sp. 7M]
MSQSTFNHTVQPPTAETIQAWLVAQITEQMGSDSEEIDVTATFDVFGLDSAQAMLIASRTEKQFGFKLSPNLLWRYPTIQALSQRLAEEAETEETELFEI